MANNIRLRCLVSDALTDAECRLLVRLLDTRERQRAMRFRFANDRRDYIAAHALKRAVLSATTGQEPRSLSFESSPFGKPALVSKMGVPEVAFNISHTNGCVAVACGEGALIGVDVEYLARPVPEDAAEHLFATEELHEINRGKKTEWMKRFYTLWTLKEAYMKATGFGVQLPLDSFAIALQPPRLILGADANGFPYWKFHVEQVACKYVAAIAIGGDTNADLKVSSNEIELKWLLDIARTA